MSFQEICEDVLKIHYEKLINLATKEAFEGLK